MTPPRGLAQELWLFYSNHRPEDAPFLDDLQKVASVTPSFHFVPTMTKMAESKQPWRGETGMIDREMLNRHLLNSHGSVYYVAGPPAMVTAMHGMLLAAESTRTMCAPKSLPAIEAVNTPVEGPRRSHG